MLYEMVTGLQPYQAESTERLERMVRSHIPPPPAPDPCPEPLRRILMKSMAADVNQRYDSATAFADDLQRFQAGGAVRAESEDLDATRRTFRRDFDDTHRSEGDDDAAATHRTTPRETDRPATWPFRKRGWTWKTLSKGMRVVAILALLFVVAGAWDALAKYHLYENGQALQHQIE